MEAHAQIMNSEKSQNKEDTKTDWSKDEVLGIQSPPQIPERPNKKTTTEALKFDYGKPRWDLLPLEIIESVVEVLTFGARKYDDDNWKKFSDIPKTYFPAAMRHLTKWQAGEKLDKESGLPHLSHAMCCLLFVLWSDKLNQEKAKETL